MWVYQVDDDGIIEVGFYNPQGEWFVDSCQETREAARARVSYLNGGAAP